MAKKVRKQGKKNRKHGRNKAECQRYRDSGHREANKRKNALRHFKRYGGPRPV